MTTTETIRYAKRSSYNTDRLKGLELARYVLHKLHRKNFDLKSLATEFDGSEKFVKSIIEFLIEIEWVTQDENGTYRLTSEGHRNCLDKLRF